MSVESEKIRKHIAQMSLLYPRVSCDDFMEIFVLGIDYGLHGLKERVEQIEVVLGDAAKISEEVIAIAEKVRTLQCNL